MPVFGAGPVVLLFPISRALMWQLAEGALTLTPIVAVESTDDIPERFDSELNHSLLSGPSWSISDIVLSSILLTKVY